MLRAPLGAFAIHPATFCIVIHIVNMKAKTGVSDRGRVRSVIGGTNHRS
jgi:hypothetical protein